MRNPYDISKLCRGCGKILYPDAEDSVNTIAGWYHESCLEREEAKLEEFLINHKRRRG